MSTPETSTETEETLDPVEENTCLVRMTPMFFDSRVFMEAVAHVQEAGGTVGTIKSAWLRLAFQAGRDAEIGRNLTKIKTAVTIPALEFGQGLRALESVGMIVVTMSDAEPPVMSGDDFETFWNRYPKRNGVRVGKTESKRLFLREIKSHAEFDRLLNALDNYTKVCGDYPKDPVRFLRGGVWREYADLTPDTLGADQTRRRQQNELNQPGTGRAIV